MAEQSDLEKIGIKTRKELLVFNFYKGSSDRYSVIHKNALSDGDDKGKGTGQYMDTANGGSRSDIYGDPSVPGSGRINQIVRNKFNSASPYLYPDTSGNIDQYRNPM